jgi:hypothetical protein
MKLEQNCEAHEKTRAEWAAETIEERMAIAEIAGKIVAAELPKYPSALTHMDNGAKANLCAHAVQLAFAIAKAVAMEDVRRHGQRIDHV